MTANHACRMVPDCPTKNFGERDRLSGVIVGSELPLTSEIDNNTDGR